MLRDMLLRAAPAHLLPMHPKPIHQGLVETKPHSEHRAQPPAEGWLTRLVGQMNMKPYKAKSLSGAEKRVRQLRKQIKERDSLLHQFDRDRRLMAMLASDTPQFDNPLLVYEAKQIRDRILALPNAAGEPQPPDNQKR